MGSRLLQALGEDDVCTAKLLCKTIACLVASGSFAIDCSSSSTNSSSSNQDQDQHQDQRVGLSGIMEQLVGVVDAGADMDGCLHVDSR